MKLEIVPETAAHAAHATRTVHTPNTAGHHPPPIMFPDLVSQEREHQRREAVRLSSAARQAEALRAATANGHDAGYDEGYGTGARMGLLFGAVVGCLTTGIVGAVVYGVRAWVATL